MKNFKTKLVSLTLSLIVAVAISGCDYDGLEPSKPGLLVPRTVDQDAALPQLAINGTKLHLETFGNPDDPIIVAIHGGPGSDYRTLLNCKAFASHGYFVIFYDQRGCGLSQRHSKDTYTVDLMIEDLEAIVHHFRGSPDQKVFLLGHSWGAMLATAYIDRHPTEISGAILSEPGGLNWDDTQDYLDRMIDPKILSEGVNDTFFYDQILTGKENDHEILDYKYALMTAYESSDANPVGNAGPTPFWRHGAVAHYALIDIAEKDGFDFTKNLNQFTTKVLFCYSSQNPAYGPQHAQHVSSAYPNAQLELITGTGHDIPWFGWQKYYPLVLEYLNELN